MRTESPAATHQVKPPMAAAVLGGKTIEGVLKLHHSCSLSHDALGELGEANLRLVSAQPKSTRRTLAGLLSQVALELAERAGMRLAAALGTAVHRGTLLRLVLGLPDPVASAAPDMVGADDFALRHGHIYATSWPVLPPGEPSTCCLAGAHAEGARDGAPAVQVADRWHLWHDPAEHTAKAVARTGPASSRSARPPPTPARAMLVAGDTAGILPGGRHPATGNEGHEHQDSRWLLDAAGDVPRTREATAGMALVDAQLLAAMRRTITPGHVQFDLRPYRALTPAEIEALDQAASRYGAYLRLKARLTRP